MTHPKTKEVTTMFDSDRYIIEENNSFKATAWIDFNTGEIKQVSYSVNGHWGARHGNGLQP